MAQLSEIVRYLDEHLEVDNYSDSALNGLQVEGRAHVERLAVGVSASGKLFEEAIDWGAQAVLVHHGLFWGKPQPVVGPLAGRLRTLLKAEVSLLAYHIPLDAHAEDGNNALIARKIGLHDTEAWGVYRGKSIGIVGSLPEPLDGDSLRTLLKQTFGGDLFFLGAKLSQMLRVAICSGGAGSMLDQAIAAGAQVLITGEPGEPAQELAREAGVLVVGAGHYRTERFGVQALAKRLTTQLGVESRFIEVPNPI